MTSKVSALIEPVRIFPPSIKVVPFEMLDQLLMVSSKGLIKPRALLAADKLSAIESVKFEFWTSSGKVVPEAKAIFPFISKVPPSYLR